MLELIYTLTFIVYVAAIYLRRIKVRDGFSTDYFALFLFASFAYCFLGQVTTIKYDNFSEQQLQNYALFVFCNGIVLMIAALIFPRFDFYKNRIADVNYQKYFIIGIVALLIAYWFWHLNYSRVGGILASIFEEVNRSDRNAMLTEQRGNLPFVHFFFIANIFLYYGFLIKTRSTPQSIALVCVLFLPLFSFFIFEGERSSILKHLFVFWFVTVYYRKRPPSINYKLVTSLLGVFLVFSLIGNLRSHFMLYIATGDTWYMESQLERKGLGIVIPNEFAAISFVSKTYFKRAAEGQLDYELGYTFWQAVPYLFPRSVYDFFESTKTPTISDKFGDSIASETQRIGNARKMGFGMPILGENYKNFGYFGALTQLIELLVLLGLVKGIMKVRGLEIVGASLLCSFFLINRVAFASMFSMIAYVSVISIIFVVLYLLIVPFVSREYLRVKKEHQGFDAA